MTASHLCKQRQHDGIDDPRKMSPDTMKQIEAFFKQYNKLDGKKFKVTKLSGPKQAIACVQVAMESKQKKKKAA